MLDYYEILGVDPQATIAEIKKAYRQRAREFHPDVSDDAQAETKFKEINAAYEILSDEQERASYDRTRGMGWHGLRVNSFNRAQATAKRRNLWRVKVQVHQSFLELVEGNVIWQDDVDAIINPVNVHIKIRGRPSLEWAIHRAAGPELAAAWHALGGCPVGQARLTPGFNLRTKWVIHAVAPFYWPRGDEAAALAETYRACLKLATEHQLAKIAFPALGTGGNNYPFVKAADVALQTVIGYLQTHPDITLVRFTLLDEMTYRIFERVLGNFATGLAADATTDN